MRTKLGDGLEAGRLRKGVFASETGDLAGAFFVAGPCGTLKIISSGHDLEFKWEHVSVSTARRCPNWEEMCFVKNLFWEDDEVVMQLHPAKKDYVNLHPYCLHLWRPIGREIPLPDVMLVGPQE